MTAPSDRRYLQSHEWHKTDGQTVTIGITQFAADELTDITFVQLPKVGTKIAANKPFGEIESVKATSDLYSGISGEVIAINDQLNSKPGLVNEDPYEKGWMVRVKAADVKELEKLLSSEDYLKGQG
jgi:glycine cleavage system H protein